MQYNRVSADCHLDMPWMPPELFVSEASADMKDRMPYVEDGPDGPQWVTKKGANFGLLNGVGPGGQKLVPGQNKRVDIMAETGMFEDGKKTRSNAFPIRTCDVRKWNATASMPKLFSVSLALPQRCRTQKPPSICSEFIMIGWSTSAATIQASTSASPACRMAIFPRRSTKSTAARNGLTRAGTVLLLGYGADVASMLGSALGSGQRG